MKCPACTGSLSPLLAAPGLELDACGACRGVWFDNLEIARLDEACEQPDEAARSIVEGTGQVSVLAEGAPKRGCPRCEGIRLRRHYFSWKRQVQVDSCASCGGTWLDHGELKAIREEYRDAAAREAHAESSIDGLLSPYEAQQATSRAALERRLAGQTQRGRMVVAMTGESPLMGAVLDTAVEGLFDGMLNL